MSINNHNKKDSSVSSVIGTFTLLVLVVLATGIIAVNVVSTIENTAQQDGPIVSFEASANPYMLYNAGGDPVYLPNIKILYTDGDGYSRDITKYCKIGIDVIDSKNIMNDDMFQIETWNTGQPLYPYTSVNENSEVKVSEIQILSTEGNKITPIYTGSAYVPGIVIPVEPDKPEMEHEVTFEIVGFKTDSGSSETPVGYELIDSKSPRIGVIIRLTGGDIGYVSGLENINIEDLPPVTKWDDESSVSTYVYSIPLLKGGVSYSVSGTVLFTNGKTQKIRDEDVYIPAYALDLLTVNGYFVDQSMALNPQIHGSHHGVKVTINQGNVEINSVELITDNGDGVIIGAEEVKDEGKELDDIPELSNLFKITADGYSGLQENVKVNVHYTLDGSDMLFETTLDIPSEAAVIYDVDGYAKYLLGKGGIRNDGGTNRPVGHGIKVSVSGTSIYGMTYDNIVKNKIKSIYVYDSENPDTGKLYFSTTSTDTKSTAGINTVKIQLDYKGETTTDIAYKMNYDGIYYYIQSSYNQKAFEDMYVELKTADGTYTFNNVDIPPLSPYYACPDYYTGTKYYLHFDPDTEDENKNWGVVSSSILDSESGKTVYRFTVKLEDCDIYNYFPVNMKVELLNKDTYEPYSLTSGETTGTSIEFSEVLNDHTYTVLVNSDSIIESATVRVTFMVPGQTLPNKNYEAINPHAVSEIVKETNIEFDKVSDIEIDVSSYGYCDDGSGINRANFDFGLVKDKPSIGHGLKITIDEDDLSSLKGIKSVSVGSYELVVDESKGGNTDLDNLEAGDYYFMVSETSDNGDYNKEMVDEYYTIIFKTNDKDVTTGGTIQYIPAASPYYADVEFPHITFEAEGYYKGDVKNKDGSIRFENKYGHGVTLYVKSSPYEYLYDISVEYSGSVRPGNGNYRDSVYFRSKSSYFDSGELVFDTKKYQLNPIIPLIQSSNSEATLNENPDYTPFIRFDISEGINGINYYDDEEGRHYFSGPDKNPGSGKDNPRILKEGEHYYFWIGPGIGAETDNLPWNQAMFADFGIKTVLVSGNGLSNVKKQYSDEDTDTWVFFTENVAIPSRFSSELPVADYIKLSDNYLYVFDNYLGDVRNLKNLESLTLHVGDVILEGGKYYVFCPKPYIQSSKMSEGYVTIQPSDLTEADVDTIDELKALLARNNYFNVGAVDIVFAEITNTQYNLNSYTSKDLCSFYAETGFSDNYLYIYANSDSPSTLAPDHNQKASNGWVRIAQSGDAVGSDTYSITKSATHGDVSYYPELNKYYDGAVVTMTYRPEDGYGLESITVTDSNGDLEVTDNKFTMRNSDVTINALFSVGSKTDWQKLTDLYTITGTQKVWADGFGQYGYSIANPTIYYLSSDELGTHWFGFNNVWVSPEYYNNPAGFASSVTQDFVTIDASKIHTVSDSESTELGDLYEYNDSLYVKASGSASTPTGGYGWLKIGEKK